MDFAIAGFGTHYRMRQDMAGQSGIALRNTPVVPVGMRLYTMFSLS
jgi:hypothetical protein